MIQIHIYRQEDQIWHEHKQKEGGGLHLHCAFTLYISSFCPILISVHALLDTVSVPVLAKMKISHIKEQQKIWIIYSNVALGFLNGTFCPFSRFQWSGIVSMNVTAKIKDVKLGKEIMQNTVYTIYRL